MYTANQAEWDTLREQGHEVAIIGDHVIDILLAPYAMRMTNDMMKAMPSAVKLAIKGARELRYAPHGKGVEKGKGNPSAKDKKPRKGKNSTFKVAASTGGAPGDAQVHRTPIEDDPGVGGTTDQPTSHTANDERIA